jgi:hypothetical protein
MLEEEQGNKIVFIRKIEQYLQELSELSKVISSITVKISLDNIMIIIMPVYFIYLKQKKPGFDKKDKQNSYFLAGTEPGSFMEKYSIVLPQVRVGANKSLA